MTTPGPARPAPLGPEGLRDVLVAVLDDLVFPARRWQVLTTGDLYGVDTATRSLLALLPERHYSSLAEIAAVITAVLAGRPVEAVGQAPRPPMPPIAPRRGPVPVAGRQVVRTPDRAPARRPVPSTPVA
ncbi:hypothetical protein ACQPX6_03640 [Actinomycetospora sp. CA-101289]|uniref:hypothetical protein n=1 Tax=Actinomycetospora sp. CA-101289 TaxID=3239893 RepID=UPI003D9959D5